MEKKKFFMIIMDGFGIGEDNEYNATKIANTPNLDRIRKNSLYSQLSASGHDVGLPKGIMGNSEVGHMNIGAGRIVYQDIVLIDLDWMGWDVAVRMGGVKAYPLIFGPIYKKGIWSGQKLRNVFSKALPGFSNPVNHAKKNFVGHGVGVFTTVAPHFPFKQQIGIFPFIKSHVETRWTTTDLLHAFISPAVLTLP